MAPNNAARGVCLFCAAAAGLWWLVVGYRSPSTGGAVFGHGGGDSDGGGWARIKGEDGKTYTQWQGEGAATLAGMVKQGDGVHGEVVEVAVNGVAGYTTYRLRLRVNELGEGGASGMPLNVYTIYGDTAHVLQMPPAFQAALPFGAHIGGSSPQFWAVKAEAQYDSWLSVSVTDGINNNEISSIGIDFDKWDARTPLYSDNGAVFWTAPDAAPSFSDQTDGSVVGQLSVATGAGLKATVNAQGRSKKAGADWEQKAISFKV